MPPRPLAPAALLLLACSAPRPAPLVEVAPPPPPPPAPVAPTLKPLGAAELAELQRLLDAAERAFFAGKPAEARASFEKAWERSHPRPLALLMAAYAAADAGDMPGAEQLLGRAREDAVKSKTAAKCESHGEDGILADSPTSAWSLGSSMERLDLRGHRVLYAFCGAPTLDPARVPDAAVSWAPVFPSASWMVPEGASAMGWDADAAQVRDLLRGATVVKVAHSIGGWSYNEGYDGALTLSADRALLASGANKEDKEVRVWRTSDGGLVRALSYDGALRNVHRIALSPDGALVAAADCDNVVVWEVASGKRLAKIRPSKNMQCVYGGALADPVERMVFSFDGALIALSYLVMGPPAAPVPEKEGGYWVGVFEVQGGRARHRRRLENKLDGLFAFSVDKSALVGRSEVLDPKSGAQRDIPSGKGSGSPDTLRWMLSEGGDVIEIGPGARVESFPLKRARMETVGAYELPKAIIAGGR